MNSYNDKQQQVDSNRQDIPSTKKNRMSQFSSEQEVNLFFRLRDSLSKHKKIAEAEEALRKLDLRRQQVETEKKAQALRKGGIAPSAVIKSPNPVITKPKLPQTGLPSIRKP